MKAFGQPGIPPTWASGRKDLVGTALGASRVWFTLSDGILTEVFWPSTGEPQIRDLGFIVAREGAWYEVKRVARYTLTTPAPGIPLPQVVHEGEGYTLFLEYLVDRPGMSSSSATAWRGRGLGSTPSWPPIWRAPARGTPPGWGRRPFTPRGAGRR